MWLKIIFLVLIYFTVGRIIINILDDRDLIYIDPSFEEWWKGWCTIFFPIILIYKGIVVFANWISDKI